MNGDTTRLPTYVSISRREYEPPRFSSRWRCRIAPCCCWARRSRSDVGTMLLKASSSTKTCGSLPTLSLPPGTPSFLVMLQSGLTSSLTTLTQGMPPTKIFVLSNSTDSTNRSVPQTVSEQPPCMHAAFGKTFRITGRVGTGTSTLIGS